MHCRPRPGSAVLIGVAFVSEAPYGLCVLRQRACWMSRTRISPNKEDDAIVTAKQREFTTFLIILVHAAEVVMH